MSLSLPRPIPFSPFYLCPPAKECEFLDLIFIGKTEASSYEVCRSVMWVCMCSLQPQTSGKVQGWGEPHWVSPQVSGVGRCIIMGAWDCPPGLLRLAPTLPCSGLPPPCPLGWAPLL